MNLSEASANVLTQLHDMIRAITRSDFSRPLLSLNNATIGQHVRHTIEFFLCLQEGCDRGVVNYDERDRNLRIETEPQYALLCIEDIRSFIGKDLKNCEILLEGSYSKTDGSALYSIKTNIERELAYNIEHAVHHMAIIKIGLAETSPGLELPIDFGVAVSTIRHRN